MTFPVRIYLDSPGGWVAFDSEQAGLPLPWGLNPEGPMVTYGSYFEALVRLLDQDRYRPLRSALSQLLGRSVTVSEIQELAVVSQKHGAFYHVAQVRVRIAERYHSLAVNSAVGTARQTFLASEYAVLQELTKSFPHGFLPRVFFLGTSRCRSDEGSPFALKCFLGEWFEGYHEFHLTRRGDADGISIKVWDAHSGNPLLKVEESRLLYRLAALILTTYYDPRSFRQIYPWRHAAGDFIAMRRKTGLKVRLITARGYFPLVTMAGADPSDRWIPLVHFFLNLSLHMRLDRLDGTGELAWASADSLQGVISGFLAGWRQKATKDPELPQPAEVLEVLQRFTVDEWLAFAPLVLDNGFEEPEELDFLESKLEEHATSLAAALGEVV